MDTRKYERIYGQAALISGFFRGGDLMTRRSNGEGSVFRRTDGRWCGAFYYKDTNGIAKRKYVYGKTQKEVKEKLRKLEEFKNLDPDAHMTLEQWMYTWLDRYKKDIVKRTTYDSYLLNVETHVAGTKLGNTELCNLNTDVLQRFYVSKLRGLEGNKVLSRRTVEYLKTIIGGALKQAYKNELIKKNYNDFTVLPKAEVKEIEPLTIDEVQKVLKAAEGTPMYALIVLDIFTGMRKGEILGLQWEYVDFENKCLYVRKNLCRVKSDVSVSGRKTEFILMSPKTKKSNRTIPLTDEVIHVLKQHKTQQNITKMKYRDVYQDNDVVFAKWDGTFENPREVLRRFHNIVEKAGVRKCRFHDLRHTFASILLNEGESMKNIQELLGHSTITTTMDVYSHISQEGKKKSIDKLEQAVKLKSS